MISDERLDHLANGRWLDAKSSEIEGMAKELLALRKVHEGWQLVPVEPTEDMMAAGTAVDGGVYCIWKDMLTAAPEPE